MGKFDGKRLLVLGTAVGSVDIVKYAKAEGAYVLVTDYLSTEKSAAKQYADETAMISTLDIEALCELAKEYRIDGVISGVSEVNIESARKVSEKLGLHSYYTSEQWNTFMDKDLFRKLCEKYNVGVPTTYFAGKLEQFKTLESNGLQITYPVIVKPVDNRANVGISVCNDRESLITAVEFAAQNSDLGKIIIEQFVKGIEVSPAYVVQNGCCKLVCMGAKYAYENEKGLKAISHAHIYPAPCLDEYISDMDSKVKEMILSQGIDNCTIFFQGIYADHRFYIFEAGLRMEGTATYRITKQINNCSFMEFMTDNALGIESDYDINCEDVTFGGRKCILLSQIATEGIIGKIEGFEDALQNPIVVAAEQRHLVGDYIAEDGTLRQIMFRYVLQSDDMEEMLNTIRYVQNTVKVYDQNGKYMLIESFDANILR